MRGEKMPRPAYGGRTTCESCKAIDVRDLHRRGLLRAGRQFSWTWRSRDRLGFRCVSVQLRVTQIRELVRRGLLPGDAQNDPYAIVKALHNYLDRTLKPY